VTGTLESSLVHLWHDGTGEMRAFLAERDEGALAGSQQQTTVMRVRVGKAHRSADSNLIDVGNLL